MDRCKIGVQLKENTFLHSHDFHPDPLPRPVKQMPFFSKCISTAAVKGLCCELSFPVPWGHIAAKAWNHPRGRPVLCLHGWADNANTFDRLIPLLPEEFYYVAFDFPGHGVSSHRPPGIPYYFTEYVADMRRVTDALNWNRFSILSHSMGANVGGLDAVQEQLQKAIDELLKLEKEPGSPRVYTPDGALKRLLQGNESVSEESAKILLQRGSTEVAEGLAFTRDLRINLPTPLRITTEQCLKLQKNITAAVLLIGAKDGLLKDEKWNPNKPPFSLILEGYHSLANQFRLEKVEGTHHVHLNQPDRVAGIISEFLRMGVSSKL
ncbi:serine hydrolase-like protein isoform X2 [Scyliorhinus torazame]|uniref:serine hydrolase-like protein isoform X2 n=1 Tax=Scyliorhinus torazame TaxID=75743 RepID=UPI003B5C32D7